MYTELLISYLKKLLAVEYHYLQYCIVLKFNFYLFISLILILFIDV